MRFTKPALSLDAQLQKLVGRGLLIDDQAGCRETLGRIGYYRLSAYTLPFQQAHMPDKPFLEEIRFKDVLDLYTFDCALRSHVLVGLERIEVTVRSVLTNHMCVKYGAHWFMDPTLFSAKYDHGELLGRLEEDFCVEPGAPIQSRPHSEVFINHYYAKYGDPHLPPGWMTAETLSLGTLSLLVSNLRAPCDRQAVSGHFGYNEAIFGPWLHTLAYIRNTCAHHSRLWNRKLVIKSPIPKKHGARIPPAAADRFYSIAVVIFDFLQSSYPASRWAEQLAGIISAHPRVRIAEMGFPPLWKKDTFWGLRTPTLDPACLI